MATVRIGNRRVTPKVKAVVTVSDIISPEHSINSTKKLVKFNPKQTYYSTNPATDIAPYALCNAFKNNPYLKEVDMSSLTTLSSSNGMQSCFENCIGLTSVDLSNLTEVSGNLVMSYCFCNCSNLVSADLSELTTVSSSNAMDYCFKDCTNLTSVDLSSLTTLSGQYAMYQCFYGCNHLTTVALSSLTTLSSDSAIRNCFENCTSLTHIDLSSLTTLFGENSMASCFKGCTSLITVGGTGSSVNLSGLTTISGQNGLTDLFWNCTGLTTANLSTITTISSASGISCCFEGCTALTSVNLSGLTDISGFLALQRCFEGCTSLTSVTIGNANTMLNFGTNTNQFTNLFINCSQNITLTVGTKSLKLSQLAGYDTSGQGHHFGCTGVVTLVPLFEDATITLDITGSWTSIYIAATGLTYDNTATTFPLEKGVSTNYIIKTPTGIYTGYYAGTSGTTGTLTVDLTAATYNTITFQPDTVTTCLKASLKTGSAFGSVEIPCDLTTRTAQISNNAYLSGIDMSYMYFQQGYIAAEGTTTYITGDMTIQMTMVAGGPVWVANVAGQTYPWRVAETVVAPTGYELYESTNWHVDNTNSVSKVYFYGTSFTCYINSYAESTYDYTIISKVDVATIPTTRDDTNTQAHTSGSQKDPTVFPGNYTQVDYTGLTNDLHYVYIVYRKDTSTHTANDRGYLAFAQPN